MSKIVRFNLGKRLSRAAFIIICMSSPVQAGNPVPAAVTAADSSSESSVYAEFTRGVYLMETGQLTEAARLLESAWRSSAYQVPIGRRLADVYFDLKRFDRCELVLDNIISQRPSDYDALLLKAKVRYFDRDRSDAISILEQIRSEHGARSESEGLLGNMYAEGGDAEKALEAYARCLELNPSQPYIQYRYGTLLAEAFRYSEAEVALQAAIDLDPAFIEPALELANIYVESGRAEDAMPVLEGALNATPDNLSVLAALAQVYLETGHLDEGIRVLEDRKSRGPLPREAEILLGRLYYEAKDYAEATAIFSALFEKESKSPELARILGEVSLRAGDAEKSARYFDTAIALDRSDYRSYIGKFFAASRNFNTEAAVIELGEKERAALLDTAAALVKGYDFEGNYVVGISYLSVDSLRIAETFLLRANELKQKDEGTLLNLASVYEKLKRYGDAERHLAVLYELKPDDPTVCNFYGYLLAEMDKDLERAEKLVLKAVSGDPENGYYLDSLGWVYYQMGDYARAVAELEKASRRVPDDPVILEHLGDAYRALRRFADAKAAYERSIALQDGNSVLLEKLQSTTGEKP